MDQKKEIKRLLNEIKKCNEKHLELAKALSKLNCKK